MFAVSVSDHRPNGQCVISVRIFSAFQFVFAPVFKSKKHPQTVHLFSALSRLSQPSQTPIRHIACSSPTVSFTITFCAIRCNAKFFTSEIPIFLHCCFVVDKKPCK